MDRRDMRIQDTLSAGEAREYTIPIPAKFCARSVEAQDGNLHILIHDTGAKIDFPIPAGETACDPPAIGEAEMGNVKGSEFVTITNIGDTTVEFSVAPLD